MARRSIFARRRADHEREARLLEMVTKSVVANQHAAAGSKYGTKAADSISFLSEKHVRVASTEKMVAAFGGKPLFSEAQMEEIRRGRGQRG